MIAKKIKSFLVFSVILVASFFVFTQYDTASAAKDITIGQTGDTIKLLGNVGVGVESPVYRLDVGSATNHYIRSYGGFIGNATANIGGTGDAAFFPEGIYSSKTNWLYGGINMNNGILSGVGSATFSGNVGIGSSTPIHRLSVAGSTTNYNIDAGNRKIGNVGTATADQDAVNLSFLRSSLSTLVPGGASSTWTVSGNNIYNRNQTGNVGIGTANPNEKLHVSSGNIIFDNGYNLRSKTSAGTISNVFGTTANQLLFGSGNWDSIRFDVGGAAGRMYINSSGNVGIGTASPVKSLQLNYASNSTGITGEGLGGGTAGKGLLINNTQATAGVYANLDFRANNADGRIAFVYNAINDGDFHFITDNSGTPETKLIIKSTGNVGIGSTSPIHRLSVAGSTTDYNIDAGNKRVGNLADPVYDKDAVTYGLVKSIFTPLIPGGASSTWTVSGNNIYNRNQTGNVGIGTTAPGDKLEVSGNILLGTNDKLGFRYSSGNTSYNYITATDQILTLVGGVWTSATTQPAIRMSTQQGEKVTLLNNGNFGIGTANPLAKFHVNGSILETNNYGAYHFSGLANYDAPGFKVGTLKIAMPASWDGTMGSVTIKGYDYPGFGAWEVVVSGYNYTGNPNPYWAGVTAEIRGSAPFSKIRLAHDGTNNVILLGELTTSWGYEKVVVTDFITSHGKNWGSGWSISLISDEANINSINTPNIHTYITSAGNVGIGSTSPIHKLSIAGSTTDYNIDAGNKKIGNVGTATADQDAVNLSFLRSSLSTLVPGGASSTWTISGNNIYNNNQTGNVGIGTTTPGSLLTVGNNLGLTAGGAIYGATSTRYLDLAGVLGDSLSVPNDIHSTAGELKTAGTGNNWMMGNLGLGTSNPGTSLEIVKNNQDLTPNTSGNARVHLGLTTNDAQGINIGPALGFGGQYIDGSTGNILFGAIAGRKENSTSGNADGYLSFNVWQTNGLKEKMRISSTGNVGIGSTSPIHKLSIAGSTTDYNIDAGNKKIGNVGTATADQDAVNLSFLRSSLSTLVPGGASSTWTVSGNNIYNRNQTGNVGIGTTNPGLKLSVVVPGASELTGVAQNSVFGVSSGSLSGTAGDELLISSLGYTAGSNKVSLGISGYRLNTGPSYTTAGIVLGLNVDNTSRSGGYISLAPQGKVGIGRINPSQALDVAGSAVFSGNVGIGTTSPATKLDVYGYAYFGISNKLKIQEISDALSIQATSAASDGIKKNIILNTWGGNVGIGSTSPIHKLSVAGSPTGYNIDAGNKRIGNIADPTATKDAVTLGFLNSSLSALASGGASSTWTLSGTNLSSKETSWNVGIGNNSPGTYKLNVTGTTYFNGNSTINGIATINSGLELATGGTRSLSYSGSFASGYFTQMQTTATSGYGTYGPVSGDWALYNRFGGATTRGWIWQLGTVNVAALNGQGSLQIAGNFNSQGTGNNYFAGNVGIGSTTPAHKLSVANTPTDYAIDAGNRKIGNVGTATEKKDVITKEYLDASLQAFAPGGASTTWNLVGNNLTAKNTGWNVGIGLTTPSQKLDVSGRIALDGTTIAYLPTAFTGTLILGDGGTKLLNTTGTEGYYNTFVGIGAGARNTTGQRNTANGLQSLYYNTTGNYNTANGYQSLYANTTGGANTANGFQSLYFNTTGSSNTANGMYSLRSNTTGSQNTANGMYSLYSNTTGNYNTANGSDSLYSNTTGSRNTAYGFDAGSFTYDGFYNETGSNSLFLGADTSANADGETNQIVIGYGAEGNGSNTATIGNAYITTTILKGNVGIGSTSPIHKLSVAGSTTDYNIDAGNKKIGNVADPTFSKDAVTLGFLDSSLSAFAPGGASSTWTLSGTNLSSKETGWNVGIGITTPTTKLHVGGTMAGGDPFYAAHFSNLLSYGAGTGLGPVRITLGRNSTVHGYIEAGSSSDNDSSNGYMAFGTRRPVNSITEAMRIDRYGNVGIGSTTPAHRLSVAGSPTDYNIDAGNKRIGNIADPTATKDAVTLGFLNSSLSTLVPGGASSTWTISGNNIYNNNQTGNVGIGTTAPDAKLNVIGSSNTMGGIHVTAQNVTDAPWISFGVNGLGTSYDNFGSITNSHGFRFRSMQNVSMIAGSGYAFKVLDPTAATTYFTVLGSNGNIGIGTTTPGQKLSVYNGRVNITDVTPSSYSVLEFGNNTTPLLGGFFAAGSTAAGYGGAGSLNLVNLTSGPLAFGTDNTIDMVIKTGGNVGIGTTAPDYPLDVAGTISFTNSLRENSLSNKLILYAAVGSGTELHAGDATGLIFKNASNSEKVRMDNNGNVGIGSTTPIHKLSIAGSPTDYNIDAGNKRIGNIADPTATKDAVTLGFLNSSLSALASGGASSTWTLSGTNLSSKETSWNVGIGNNSPGTYKLNVTGTTYFNGNSTINGIATINSGLELATGGTRSLSYYGSFASGYFTQMQTTATSGYGTYGPVSGDWALYNRFGGANTRGWIWQLGTVNVAALNGQGSLQIAGNFNSQGAGNNYFAGNVGIGTTSPTSAKLHLYGAGSYDTVLRLQNSGTGGQDAFIVSTNNTWTDTGGSKLGFGVGSPGSANVKMVINNLGNVGIGSTTPIHRLSVAGSTTDYNIDAGNKKIGNVADPTFSKDVVTLGFLDSSLSAFAPGGASSTWTVTGDKLYVNDTSWNVGIGVEDPATPLSLANNAWISAKNQGGTGYVNMFKLNTNNQIEVGAPLLIGPFEFAANSGLVSFLDMPITASSPLGTPQGYVMKIDGENVLSVYSESNGSGGIQNKRIGIGTGTPLGTLHVKTLSSAQNEANSLVIGGDTNATMQLRLGRSDTGTYSWIQSVARNVSNDRFLILNPDGGSVGIGVTAPSQKLQVAGGLQLGAVAFGTTPGSGQTNALTTVSYVNAKAGGADGLVLSRRAVANANYTAVGTDYLIAYTSLSANRTLTIPTAIYSAGKALMIANETNTAFSVVVTPQSGSISGSSSFSLPAQSVIPLYCNGTNWFIY